MASQLDGYNARDGDRPRPFLSRAPLEPSSAHTTRTWLEFGLVCLVFSTTWLAIKVSLDDFPPLGAAGLRYLVACPVLFALARARRRPWPRTFREWQLPLVLGLTMFTIPFALIYYAEQTVPSGLAAVLFATHAIFVAILSHWFLHGERLTSQRVTGALAGFAGLFVVFWDRMSGHASWLGESALVLTAAIQGGTAIILRRHSDTAPLVQSCIGAGVGAVVLLLSSVVFERGWFDHVTPRGVLAVLYLALFGSVIAFTLSIALVHRIGPNRVAMTVFITPILALSWGALFMGEPVNARIALGTALVVGGVWLTNRVA